MSQLWVPGMAGPLEELVSRIHRRIEAFKETYGVALYQEQVMKFLNVVGDIPLIHCEKIRKAISKKNEKFFGRLYFE